LRRSASSSIRPASSRPVTSSQSSAESRSSTDVWSTKSRRSSGSADSTSASEVLHEVLVRTRELAQRGSLTRPRPERDRREVQRRDPPFRPLLKRDDLAAAESQAQHVGEKCPRLAPREAEVGRSDLGELSATPQPGERQGGTGTGDYGHLQRRRHVLDEEAEHLPRVGADLGEAQRLVQALGKGLGQRVHDIGPEPGRVGVVGVQRDPGEPVSARHPPTPLQDGRRLPLARRRADQRQPSGRSPRQPFHQPLAGDERPAQLGHADLGRQQSRGTWSSGGGPVEGGTGSACPRGPVPSRRRGTGAWGTPEACRRRPRRARP
jgi:hypothetical protein